MYGGYVWWLFGSHVGMSSKVGQVGGACLDCLQLIGCKWCVHWSMTNGVIMHPCTMVQNPRVPTTVSIQGAFTHVRATLQAAYSSVIFSALPIARTATRVSLLWWSLAELFWKSCVHWSMKSNVIMSTCITFYVFLPSQNQYRVLSLTSAPLCRQLTQAVMIDLHSSHLQFWQLFCA